MNSLETAAGAPAATAQPRPTVPASLSQKLAGARAESDEWTASARRKSRLTRLGRMLFGVMPPPWYPACMGGLLVGTGAAGGVAGYTIALILTLAGIADVVHPGVLAACGTGLGVLIFATRLGRVESRLNAHWKLHTAARVGMKALPPSWFLHVIYSKVRLATWAQDIGLLEETPDALVFHGQEGNESIPHAAIATATPDGFLGAKWLRLGLADGSARWILVQEGSTAWGGCSATAELAQRILTGSLERMVARHRKHLTGCTVRSIPDKLRELSVTAEGLQRPFTETSPDSVCVVIAAALTLMLDERGWTLGRAGLIRGETVLNPFDMIQGLLTGALPAQSWEAMWSHAGIDQVDLGDFILDATDFARRYLALRGL